MHPNLLQRPQSIILKGALSHTTLTNCVFDRNTANVSAGGLLVSNDAGVQAIHCTFSGNDPWAITHEIDQADPLLVTNSVLWGNINPDGTSQPIRGVATVNYTTIEGGWTGSGGVGNIDADPQFIDPATGDFHLARGSPANDAGDNTSVPAGTTTDLDGNPRFADDSCAPDTGVPDGINPIVDMGAFETPPCPADLTGDCQTDVLDFFVFVGLFGTGDPRADINGDGSIDVLDFFTFIVAFAGGCP